MTDGADAQYLHRDHLNSVRWITDGTGSLAERRIYYPFGEIFPVGPGTTPGETFGFVPSGV